LPIGVGCDRGDFEIESEVAMKWITTFVLLFSAALIAPLHGQESEGNPDDTEQQERFAAFEKMLGKSVFVGHFMVDGDQKQDRRPERYGIQRITKLEKGDYWSFFVRITYGNHDVTVPLPVEVKWAGSTPVITVDELFIPGLGTFDARVVVSDNKYAGTWRHGKVGGLMFGHIEKQQEEEQETETDTETETDKVEEKAEEETAKEKPK